MTSFAAWGLTILGLAAVSTIAEMLLPQGKTRTVIRSVFATVTVLTVITPIPMLIEHGVHFDFSQDTVQTDEGYLEYVYDVRKELVAQSAKEYLNSLGYEVGVEVVLDGWTVKSATLIFSDIGITQNDKHINKSEIIRLVAEYLGIGEEAIMTYG